jgi:hypothetical protein
MVLNCNAIADEIGRVNDNNNKSCFFFIVFSSSAMMQRAAVCHHSVTSAIMMFFIYSCTPLYSHFLCPFTSSSVPRWQ